MLVNPVEDDWWEFVTLDTSSGVVAPRFTSAGILDPRGVATLEVFVALTYESVIEGRYRSVCRLQQAAELGVDRGDTRVARVALGKALNEDDYGAASWFSFGPGTTEEPFRALRNVGSLWKRFVRAASANHHSGRPR